MKSSTLQFVVAGALIAAWAWMLGRPILTNLLRRSRRDSVGHFRYQQAVLGQPMGQEMGSSRWADRPRPLADWRAQPVERRRLQVMLGFAIATFVSLLLAIALRGSFIRLFAFMAVCFVAYLAVAVYIGSAQLRRRDLETRRSVSAPMQEAAVGRTAVRRAPRREAAAPILEDGDSATIDPGSDPSIEFDDFENLELFGQGIFDDGFYEPIPELAFQPLSLDSSLLRPSDEPVDGDHGPPDEQSADGESAPEPNYFESVLFRNLEDDDAVAGEEAETETEAGEEAEAEDHSWAGEPILEAEAEAEADGEAEAEADGEAETEAEADREAEAEVEAPRPEPTFTTPPPQRTRPPKRNKARPIYIESQLDEDGQRVQAVND